MSDRERYEPEYPEGFERTLKLMAAAEDAEQLKAIMLLFVFDLSYSRQDILMAERITKQEKGWPR